KVAGAARPAEPELRRSWLGRCDVLPVARVPRWRGDVPFGDGAACRPGDPGLRRGGGLRHRTESPLRTRRHGLRRTGEWRLRLQGRRGRRPGMGPGVLVGPAGAWTAGTGPRLLGGGAVGARVGVADRSDRR